MARAKAAAELKIVRALSLYACVESRERGESALARPDAECVAWASGCGRYLLY